MFPSVLKKLNQETLVLLFLVQSCHWPIVIKIVVHSSSLTLLLIFLFPCRWRASRLWLSAYKPSRSSKPNNKRTPRRPQAYYHFTKPLNAIHFRIPLLDGARRYNCTLSLARKLSAVAISLSLHTSETDSTMQRPRDAPEQLPFTTSLPFSN